MHTLLQDVRYAFRQFGNHPGFALTAILSLALGIGATVSVFSIVYAVLMNPWPYAGADRISTISLLDKGLAVLTGVLFGLFPALQLARPEISQSIQASSRKVVGTVRGKRFHNALIAGQIALTLLLMTAAGAAIEGFVHMMRIPLGYDPHHVMSVGIPIHENTYKSVAERSNYYEQLRDKIGALPDVLSTGISTNATPPNAVGSRHLSCRESLPAKNERRDSSLLIQVTSALCTCRCYRVVCGTKRKLPVVRPW
jgi:hypothetical protein